MCTFGLSDCRVKPRRLSFHSDFSDELHVIPNFAAITVLEEAVDLVVELLQLERSDVLLVEIQQFHLIFVNFFCHKRLEIGVC